MMRDDRRAAGDEGRDAVTDEQRAEAQRIELERQRVMREQQEILRTSNPPTIRPRVVVPRGPQVIGPSARQKRRP